MRYRVIKTTVEMFLTDDRDAMYNGDVKPDRKKECIFYIGQEDERSKQMMGEYWSSSIWHRIKLRLGWEEFFSP